MIIFWKSVCEDGSVCKVRSGVYRWNVGWMWSGIELDVCVCVFCRVVECREELLWGFGRFFLFMEGYMGEFYYLMGMKS